MTTWMRHIVLGLLLNSAFLLLAHAETGKGYLGFAAKTQDGPSTAAACRSFGGYPVAGKLFGVVMNMGRQDNRYPNVLFYGGHRYVTFTMENKTFWGGKESSVVLCHFAG